MNKVREIFQKLDSKLENRKSELSGVAALIKFDISGPDGGMWVVDLNDHSIGIRESDESANCTLSATDSNFIKLVNRELKPETAILTGKVKISGDVALAMRLATLFK